MRVWKLPVETLLNGGIVTLPLAPIVRVKKADVASVISRMDERIENEVPNPTEATELWTTTAILMGLRYNQSARQQLLKGIYRMRESPVYQEILEEGRLEGQAEGALREARRALVRVGQRRLGTITPRYEARINAVESLVVLEALLDMAFDVETWSDLLASLPTEPNG